MKKSQIQKLKKERDKLAKEYKSLPRKDSFSGWHMVAEIETISDKINRYENNHSKKTRI